MIVASAVPDVTDLDHAPLWMSVILRLGYGIVYLWTKFDDSSFGHSEISLEVQKFKIGHVTLATFLKGGDSSSVCWDFT